MSINRLSILLELGVEDNPIWVWLLSRYAYLKNKLVQTFESARMEIEGKYQVVYLAEFDAEKC